MPADRTENVRYETQKPLSVAERIIGAASDPGDIVADVFCGSGTTLVAAEQLGRRWIGCDLGRFAIHTTRKRLLNIPDCRPFDIKNLGAYERQRWQVATGNGALRAYLDTILAFYRAEPIEGFAHLHGRKAGPDGPRRRDGRSGDDRRDRGRHGRDGRQRDRGVRSARLGVGDGTARHDHRAARRRGLDLRPRQIPREVMERQVTEADAVRFFELAHVDLDVRRQGHEACVVLKDFANPERGADPSRRSARGSLRGRISSTTGRSTSTSATRSSTTSGRLIAPARSQPSRPRATGTSIRSPGRYAIVVKIIDIFGNDTTKLAEVRIK